MKKEVDAMTSSRSPECYCVARPDVLQQVERRIGAVNERRSAGPWSYDMKRGRQTVRLNTVEYRIFRFLAARPYHAYTRRRIAEAVSTESQPVTAETLRRYIASLRDKLGFFADYIQSVPYIGYRFKA